MATKAKSGPGGAQKKGRSAEGRTTSHHPGQSHRYTPPVARSVKKSPKWMGILIIGLFVLGVLLVILNYADALPGGVNNWPVPWWCWPRARTR